MKRALLKILLTVMVLPPLTALAKPPVIEDECVILLHGLGRSGYSMKAVEWALAKQGYAVVNISYPSLSSPIAELSTLAIDKGLQRCRDQNSSPVHFVTHSLGGILLRQYLAEKNISELGRAVMLGPPNQGSQLADQIQSYRLSKYIQPPAASQLGTGDGSVPVRLGAVNFELGVIAGTKNARPFIAGGINEPSDGTVTVEETKVAGMTDFLKLATTHTFMMWNADVLEQVAFFIKNGEFNRSK